MVLLSGSSTVLLLLQLLQNHSRAQALDTHSELEITKVSPL